MEQFSRVRISGEVRSKTFGLTYLRKFWKIQFYSDKKRHDPMHRRRHFVYWKSYPFWSETFRIMINCYNIDCFIGWLPNFQWCAETKYSSFWYGLDVSLLLISKWNISNRKKNDMWFQKFRNHSYCYILNICFDLHCDLSNTSPDYWWYHYKYCKNKRLESYPFLWKLNLLK